MEFEDLPPKADAMIASMRAIGYDLPMAIADIVDNSIYAKAQTIVIDYDWNDGDPWIRIFDDGSGMSEENLREAMRLGSQGPGEMRDPDDLGRFGLGLKTASFSQCRIFSVRSKINGGATATRCWNLDLIERTKSWSLSKSSPIDAECLLDVLDNVENGTVVLWQHLDRIVDSLHESEKARETFLNKFNDVRVHLEMVFHRFLSGPGSIKMFIGRTPLRPWDPFLLTNNFTQPLSSSEKYEDGSVKIIPYVLPHVSNRTAEETERGRGPKGWNAQQGFYVYRNRRMIVSGGYLDLNYKPEEHYKLARILVDLKNSTDNEWHIDVKKATVIPPDRLRMALDKVARATREEAVKVYRVRTQRSRGKGTKKNRDVWVKRRKGDKIIYQINQENEVIKKIIEELAPPEPWVRKLFDTIERTIPHREIEIDAYDREDCHVDLPPEICPPDQSLIDLCKEFYWRFREEGREHNEAVDLTISVEPFNTHPAFRATLDKIAEEE